MNQINPRDGASTQNLNSADVYSVRKSAFQYDSLMNTTLDMGFVYPIDWFYAYPGDSFDISIEYALDSLPLVTGVQTPVEVTVSCYSVPLYYLWEGAEVLMTRGRLGTENLSVPWINPSKQLTRGGSILSFATCHSLSAFLGCPPSLRAGRETINGVADVDCFAYPWSQYPSDTYPTPENNPQLFTGFTTPSKVSVLPFMAYQNICKYHEFEENLLEDCYFLYPREGDFNWRLPYSADGQEVDYINGHSFGATATLNTTDLNFIQGIFPNDIGLCLHILRPCMNSNDYFSTSLLSPTRGNPPTLAFDVYGLNISPSGSPNYTDFNLNINQDSEVFPISGDYLSPNVALNANAGSSAFSGSIFTRVDGQRIASMLNASGSAQASITANKLRELLALSVMQERNARVNGSYNSLVWVQWNENPNHPDNAARFIGGYTRLIQFGETVQQSASTSDSPLGTKAGYANARNDGYIAHVNSNDYQIIMTTLKIRPIETYDQGLDRQLTLFQTDDFPLPAMEQLSMEPILNKEIVYTGNQVEDDKPFGYQQRYAWLKSRVNVNRGLFQSLPEKDIMFGGALLSRRYSAAPTLSYNWRRLGTSIPRYHLAYPAYPMFKAAIARKVSAIRPFAHSARPNTFGF